MVVRVYRSSMISYKYSSISNVCETCEISVVTVRIVNCRYHIGGYSNSTVGKGKVLNVCDRLELPTSLTQKLGESSTGISRNTVASQKEERLMARREWD